HYERRVVCGNRRRKTKRPAGALTLPLRYLSLPFGVHIAQHGISQQGIRAGLVAAALPPQPSDDVGVKAKRELLLQGPVEGIANRVLPELLRQFRDIGSVDLVVRPPSKHFQSPFAPGCNAAIR